MPDRREVDETLARLKPVYDGIKEQQTGLARLRDAATARAEYDRALADDQAAVAEAAIRKRNLEAEEAALGRRGQTPVVVPVPTGDRRNPLRRPAGPTVWNPQDAHLDGPLPQPAPREDRVDLKNLVGRFLRYRLSSAHPEMLAEFNRLIGSADRPLGEGLALLDWTVAYCEPLNKAEEKDPAVWVDRLQRWGAELEAYRSALTADADTLRIQYEAVLPLLDRWRERASQPERWSGLIDEARAALRDRRQTLEADIATVRTSIAAAAQEGRQP